MKKIYGCMRPVRVEFDHHQMMPMHVFECLAGEATGLMEDRVVFDNVFCFVQTGELEDRMAEKYLITAAGKAFADRFKEEYPDHELVMLADDRLNTLGDTYMLPPSSSYLLGAVWKP